MTWLRHALAAIRRALAPLDVDAEAERRVRAAEGDEPLPRLPDVAGARRRRARVRPRSAASAATRPS